MKILEILKRISAVEKYYITGIAALSIQNLVPYGARLAVLDISVPEDYAPCIENIKKELKGDMEINVHSIYRENAYELKDFFGIRLNVAKCEISFIDSIILGYDLGEIVLPGLEQALYDERLDKDFMLLAAYEISDDTHKKIKKLLDLIEPERLSKMNFSSYNKECAKTCKIIASEFNTNEWAVIGAIQDALNAY